jgi:Ca2+-binding RTX toxin-like protein
MNARLTNPRRTAALAAIAAAAALAAPSAASAAVTGVVTGDTATLSGDAANDTITIGSNGVNLTHNTIAGLESATDFDSAGGVQPLTVNATLTINPGGGDDIVVGGPNKDTIDGGDGNDRLTAGPGGIATDREQILGGAGNDVMIWNNGDGHDLNDGGDGADEVLITNGTADDQMKLTANADHTLFERSNAPFTVDMVRDEKLSITSFSGNDNLETGPGVTIPMNVDAGSGDDNITTGDGADVINGGDGVDTLNGGAGGDRILGNPGNDVMNGNAGDDTLVWNNGDGNDQMNGDDGLDRIENNLGAANDVSQLSVVAGKVHYARVNAPFTLDVASSEVFELNTFGGNDTLTTAPGLGALIAVTVDAGSGDDNIVGGDEADTFFGGLGNDTLDGKAGADAVDGQDGSDTLAARDGAADLVRGGAGPDKATVDAVDAVDGVETLDRGKTGANALAFRKNAKLLLKNGVYSAKVAVTCDATALEGCKGTLALLTSGKVKIGAGRRPVQARLGSAKYNLKAGQKKTLTIKLGKGLRPLIKKNVLKVKAQAVSRDAAGSQTTRTANLSLKLAKGKK